LPLLIYNNKFWYDCETSRKKKKIVKHAIFACMKFLESTSTKE